MYISYNLESVFSKLIIFKEVHTPFEHAGHLFIYNPFANVGLMHNQRYICDSSKPGLSNKGFYGHANALRAFPRDMSMHLGFSLVAMSLGERGRERERVCVCVFCG
jgi:hypothetical protein